MAEDGTVGLGQRRASAGRRLRGRCAAQTTIDLAVRARVFSSTNAGRSWSFIGQGLPEDGVVTGLAAGAGTVYAAFGEKGIYMTSDEGRTWTQSWPDSGCGPRARRRRRRCRPGTSDDDLRVRLLPATTVPPAHTSFAAPTAAAPGRWWADGQAEALVRSANWPRAREASVRRAPAARHGRARDEWGTPRSALLAVAAAVLTGVLVGATASPAGVRSRSGTIAFLRSVGTGPGTPSSLFAIQGGRQRPSTSHAQRLRYRLL